MKRAKRVRFHDRVSDRPQSGRFENASAPSSNSPKTSEFAFFKKFRENVALKLQSKSPPRDDVQLECSNYSGGVTDNEKISKSSFFTENARPSKTDLLVSPQFVSSSPIKNNGRRGQEEDLAPSCLLKTPTSSGRDDLFLDRATESVRSDTRYMDGDIFSKKRAKLRSLVAKTMKPGNGEMLMGRDLISCLLNRLVPESFESNHCESFKSTPDKDLPESSYQLKERWTESKRKLAIRERPCFMDADASPSWPNKIHRSFKSAPEKDLPESSYQLKESWTESKRKLAKCEKPHFMDAGASSSWPNKIHRSFLLDEPVQRACLPALEYKEIEPCFSNIDHKQSWDRNSAEAFSEASGRSYGNFGTCNPRRMTLDYDSVQEPYLNDDPSSSWNYRSNSSHQKNSYSNRFLLDYEKKEPECVEDINLGSMFGYSPENCRASAMTTSIESAELDDDLVHWRRRRKTSDLSLGQDIDSGSMFGHSPENCRASAMTTCIEYDELDDDLGHWRRRRKTSDLSLGQDINSGSMFGHSPENCRASAMTTCIESDKLDDDLGHWRRRRKTSDLLLGWDIDKPKEEEIRYSFSVDTRSDSPLTISYELIPAADNGFTLSPDQHCPFPQRSYYGAIEAPGTVNSSPFLLLEGSEDERRQSSVVGEICNGYSTTSMARFSDNELLWPSQIQRLDWRDNEEEMYLL